MSDINAEDVLPKNLIDEIQKYIDGLLFIGVRGVEPLVLIELQRMMGGDGSLKWYGEHLSEMVDAFLRSEKCEIIDNTFPSCKDVVR